MEKSQILLDYLTENSIMLMITYVCLFIISYVKGYGLNGIISVIGTYYLTGLIQYIFHIISHRYDFTKIFNENIRDVLKHNKRLYRLLKSTCLYFFEFHGKIHHNSKINKKIINVITEFYINFCSSGGGLFLINNILDIKLRVLGVDFFLDNSTLILFALCYATSHMLNYHILDSSEHKKHHLNVKTNYGPELFDIIFGTKYDNIVVNENHISINIIVSTVIVLILWKYF